MTAMIDLPTIEDVAAAAGRLAGSAVRTPLLENADLNARVGGRVLIKPETLQRTGSFKFRGAGNKIAKLMQAGQRPQTILAYSSGNHAQGVAAAARLAGLSALIVMPDDAPAIKIENTRALGAEIVFYDRRIDDREAITAGLLKERGGTLVRPYDDPDVIAGQGTVGLEIAEQALERGALVDHVLVPCGGGGLTAGIALALSGASPRTRVHPVEPEGFDDTRRSLATGKALGNEPGATSFCDALLAPRPGALTFALNSRLAGEGFAVTDAETTAAMAFAFRTLKLVVEPGGAVALAAVLAGKIDCRNRTICVVLSGANADPAIFCRAVGGLPPA
jgi:threonine dehydratase